MRKITNIKEIQDILLANLVNFDSICKKNGLTYFLSNGTLLGAVKYQGFVPWDDDIDIFMPRRDYERLLKIEDFDEGPYELMAKERNSKWRVPYAKIKDKRTRVQETTADFGLGNGLSIDVFPMDNWGENKSKSLKKAKYCGLLRRFLTASLETKFTTPKTGIKKLILYFIWIYSQIKGHEYFYQKIDKIVKDNSKLENPAYVGSVVWSLYGEKEVIPKGVFEDTVYLTFCNKSFMAPAGYDSYLRLLYGEYEQDPPLEKQKSHHDIQVWREENYE